VFDLPQFKLEMKLILLYAYNSKIISAGRVIFQSDGHGSWEFPAGNKENLKVNFVNNQYMADFQVKQIKK
jgi:hypothetical protein